MLNNYEKYHLFHDLINEHIISLDLIGSNSIPNTLFHSPNNNFLFTGIVSDELKNKLLMCEWPLILSSEGVFISQ